MPLVAVRRLTVFILPTALRDVVLDVLVAGNRLAQEAVGVELLHRQPPLLSVLR